MAQKKAAVPATGNVITDATAAEQQLIAELRNLTTDAEADGEEILADAKTQGTSLWSAIVAAVNAAKTA
jgi:hypothetical protein